MRILVEISAGELIDKISILEIKLKHIQDIRKRANVARELAALVEAAPCEIAGDVASLREELEAVNSELWRIEDAIREHERDGDFGDSFVSLARSVYVTNDRRAWLKREINARAQSELVEEKSYAVY